MKKLLILFVTATSLLLTTIGLATTGTLPQCHSGALNIEIYNKDVSDCGDRNNPNPACIDLFNETFIPYAKEACNDDVGITWPNTNASMSYANNPQQVILKFHVYYNHKQRPQLVFTYNSGNTSDNCMEVFGSGVKCILSKTEYDGHPLYTLKIQKKE